MYDQMIGRALHIAIIFFLHSFPAILCLATGRTLQLLCMKSYRFFSNSVGVLCFLHKGWVNWLLLFSSVLHQTEEPVKSTLQVIWLLTMMSLVEGCWRNTRDGSADPWLWVLFWARIVIDNRLARALGLIKASLWQWQIFSQALITIETRLT